jgi:allantoate deiminase
MKEPSTGLQHASIGDEIVSRIDQLAAISETPEHLTRIFLTKEHRAAADLILDWMRDAGMRAHLDAIGNVCGRYESEVAGSPCLMLGSHYDTVRDAGKWDGPLGLITAISCVAELHRSGRRLPFAIEVTGFADEEGVRFASTLLGSRAVAGTFDESVLGVKDTKGISLREALSQFGLDPDRIGAAARTRGELLAYLELHIEQGPLLEGLNLPVGVVTAISGATRLAARLAGMAGHAGTVPMPLRRDASGGCGGMHCGDRGILPERPKRAGRDRRIHQRHARREQRHSGAGIVHHRYPRAIRSTAQARGRRHRPPDRKYRQAPQAGAASRCHPTHENPTVPCASWLKDQLSEAIAGEGCRVFELPSGAGHDGMAMIDIADVAMLFVRCRGGISHHPAEHVDLADVEAGARVLLRLIENFRPRDAAQ